MAIDSGDDGWSVNTQTGGRRNGPAAVVVQTLSLTPTIASATTRVLALLFRACLRMHS